MNFKTFFFAIVVTYIIGACSSETTSVKKESWGKHQNKDVILYTLTNKNNMSIKLTNFGATVTSVIVPDKNGKFDDVALGFDNLAQYVGPSSSIGATIGRFANRIRNAKLTVNDTIYNLKQDSKGHILHGGFEFENAVWDAEVVQRESGNGIRFHYFSKDGTNGFPGNVHAYATYILTENNEMEVSFEATTDKATHVNMTQHCYFNLNGGSKLIYDHIVQIDADTYTELDKNAIPTGIIDSLRNKPWNLVTPTRLGDKIHHIPNNGYHHCYALNKKENEYKKVAFVVEPTSGRTLEVSTTQPGIVFYASNVLGKNEAIVGKYGIKYTPHIAFCIETQGFPDAPNRPHFPSTLLLPNETYKERVTYKFGIQ